MRMQQCKKVLYAKHTCISHIAGNNGFISVFPSIDFACHCIRNGTILKHIPPCDDLMLFIYCQKGALELKTDIDGSIKLHCGDFAAIAPGSSGCTFWTMNKFSTCILIKLHLCQTMQFVARSFKLLSVHLHTLRDQLCPDNKHFFLFNHSEIAYLLSDIEQAPKTVLSEFLQLRMMDLLLFLTTVHKKPGCA